MAGRETACDAGRGRRTTASGTGRGRRTTAFCARRDGREAEARTDRAGREAAGRADHEAEDTEDLAVHRGRRHRRTGAGRRSGDRRGPLGLHWSAYGGAGPGGRPGANGWRRSRRLVRFGGRGAPARPQRRLRARRPRRCHERRQEGPDRPGPRRGPEPLLRDPALGARSTAAVVDVATGKRLYGTGADEALTPASTTKIATAVAALSALGADHRLTTRAALEPDTDELVLVGGGDPTLTARKDAEGWASLRTLADDTAAALKKRDINQVTLSYDTTLYAGSERHPIGVNDNLALVTALMADEARTDDSASGPAPRVPDPAADATRTFAELLEDNGIKTTSPGPSKATGRAESLATVSSPPLSALVERMLTNSDNDIAEALARQTAVATGKRADFDGAGRAIGAQLKKLGLPVSGAAFKDGSGLDRDDRLTADLLTALLVKAGDPTRPELRPALTGLPVAGFTGTLTSRYTDGAAGIVRAKTGTLTGVNTLAGTVVDQDGHLLAFAFLTSNTTDPAAAQSALDRTATALAACGCR